jgi:NAD(P)-dependent dehydrogenase (short-subunit alcohol dehydrogenase family)
VLLPGDLSDEAFARSLAHKAHEALGGLDVLALVAGKQTAVVAEGARRHCVGVELRA